MLFVIGMDSILVYSGESEQVSPLFRVPAVVDLTGLQQRSD